MRILKTMAILSIALTISLTTSRAAAHCPNGGKCFTEDEAAERLDQECSEARDKLEVCNSNLAKCNNKEALLNKCRGRLEEKKVESKEQSRTIRHLDKQTAELWDDSEVFQAVLAALIVGGGAGGVGYHLLRQ